METAPLISHVIESINVPIFRIFLFPSLSLNLPIPIIVNVVIRIVNEVNNPRLR